MATTCIYRISSNEVIRIDTNGSLFEAEVTDYVALKKGATYSDGSSIYDTSGKTRVFGYAKILDGDTVRNATQIEIDTFRAFEIDDAKQIQADSAISYFSSDSKFRRIMVALIKGIVKEDNENRKWIRDFKDAVAASTSLANLQTRVAALDTPVDREFEDAKDYIISQVSKDD